jgi:hypothetical protein
MPHHQSANRTSCPILALNPIRAQLWKLDVHSNFRTGTNPKASNLQTVTLRHTIPLFLLLSATLLHAQITSTPDSVPDEKPLPDVPTLMHQVETNQRLAESLEKNYIYREDSTLNELNKSGGIKKSEERAFEIFYLDGVRVARLVRKDNKDISPDELAKENERIDKEVAKAKERRAKADGSGKETNSAGQDEITVSRILELGTFSNPRRIMVAGRPTIEVDYTGNPSAKTHNPGEGAIKLITGIVCVDEQDKFIQHAEGHFTDNFKLGGGLLADISKGTSFAATNTKINDEVWLPAHAEAHGHIRYLLFFSVNGDATIKTSGYHKFKATSTILPNITVAPPDPASVPKPPEMP